MQVRVKWDEEEARIVLGEFTAEICELVKRYYLEVYGLEFDPSEYPWHKIVGYWWTAQAHFRIREFYFSLEDAKAEENKTVYIVNDLTSMTKFRRENGVWKDEGEVTIDFYK